MQRRSQIYGTVFDGIKVMLTYPMSASRNFDVTSPALANETAKKSATVRS